MSAIYSNENLNFFRLTKCVVDHSTAALRKVFIQEWNNLFTSYPWQNNTTSGAQLLAEEMPTSRRSRLYDPMYCNEYRHIKNHLSSGDVEKWDITTLAFALSYSHALSPVRSRFNIRGKKILNAIHQIREVRNTVSAHASKASISYSTFKKSVTILIQAVEDLLRKSDPLVENLRQMLTETEFTTNDLVTYKQWLKNDHDNLRSHERIIDRLEGKIKEKPGYKSKAIHTDKTRRCHPYDHRETFSRLHHRMTKLEPYIKRSVTTSVDLVPSNAKPEIFTSSRYIRLIDKSNLLSFNFCWEDLDKFLQRFTSYVDIKVFASIQAACALNQRSRKKESLEMLNGLIPYSLVTNNGVVAHARIKICKAFVLHDMGNDEEAMREVDEAEKMLSLGDCFEDKAEINNVKANIILSRSKNSKEDRDSVLYHLDKSIKYCEKVTVDKSVTMVQVTMRKALVHLGYYQHGIIEEVPRSDVAVAETVLSRIPSRQIETLSERSRIYHTYCQSLLAFRKGDTDRATKLEHKARRKCELQFLHNEIQQLDMLRGLLRGRNENARTSEHVKELTSERTNTHDKRTNKRTNDEMD